MGGERSEKGDKPGPRAAWPVKKPQKQSSLGPGALIEVYEREHETIALMRTFAESKGFQLVGPHHEIYLSDPRRVPPQRLKTILRDPVEKV